MISVAATALVLLTSSLEEPGYPSRAIALVGPGVSLHNGVVAGTFAFDRNFVAPVAHLAVRLEWPNAFVQPTLEAGADVFNIGPRPTRDFYTQARARPNGGVALAGGAHFAPRSNVDLGLGLSAMLAMTHVIEASDIAGVGFVPSAGTIGYARVVVAPGLELELDASVHGAVVPGWFARALVAVALVWRWC